MSAASPAPVTAISVTAQWSQRQKLTSTPRGVGAQFGNAVAIDANTMVVGARFDATTASQAGAAFVYVLSAGTWTQQAKLLASDGAATDKFGYSVAVSGDTIVVGAFNADAPLSNSGAAYVFVRSGTAWAQQMKVIASDATADDQFGDAVAVRGDLLVVGASHADLPSNSEAGAAYVFTRTGTTWAQIQRLNPSLDVLLGDHFGASLAIGGTGIVIGAPGDDTPFTSAGAAYVFVEAGGGSYAFFQKLTIGDGSNGDQFGSSVAFDGVTIVGGATEDTTTVGQPAFGAAYVFAFNGSTFTQQQKLVAADGASFDRFGSGVGVTGDIVAVGAWQDDTAAGADGGSAYIFTRTGTVWTQKQKVGPVDPFNGDRFGVSLALSPAGVLAVGAPEKALSSPNGQGAVYTFGPAGARPFDFDGDFKTDRTIYRPANGAWFSALSGGGATATTFGISTDLDVAADYDGDGKADIAVYRPSSGTWYVLQSSTSSYTAVSWGISTDVAVPGDYDGDGKADIAVYRPSSGTWFIQRSTGGVQIVSWGVAGDIPLTGDYDGDGKADLVIYRPSSGAWFVLNSGGAGTFSSTVWGGLSGDIPMVGDYDGDGKADPTIFRAGTGQWWVQKSTGGTLAVQWGTASDIPVSGDWDGDGRSDFTVYRPGSAATWFTQFAAGGSATVGWGTTGDLSVGRTPGF